MNFLDFVKSQLTGDEWLILTTLVQAELQGSLVGYVLHEYPITETDLRDYVEKVLNGLAVNQCNFAIKVSNAIQRYDANLFLKQHMICDEDFGNEVCAMSSGFLQRHPIVFYGNDFYVYQFGSICGEVLTGGNYVRVSQTELQMMVYSDYHKEINASKSPTLCMAIVRNVLMRAMQPPEDLYCNRGVIIFRDLKLLDLNNWSVRDTTCWDFFSRTTDVNYAEVFENYMVPQAFEEICRIEGSGNPLWRQELLEIIGCVIAGESSKNVFCFQGKMGSFKSQLISLVENFWKGDPYAKVSLRPQLINRPHELFGVSFARMLVVDDATDEALNKEFVDFAKRVSGGDDISTEQKQHDKGQELATAPILIVTNHKIKFSSDPAFKDRLVTLSFPITVPQTYGAPLREQLRKEKPVIFRLALDAHIRRIKEGRSVTNCCELNACYECESDNKQRNNLGDVLAQCCFRRHGDKMQVQKVFQNCNEIFDRCGQPKTWLNEISFGKKLHAEMENLFGEEVVSKASGRCVSDGVRGSCYYGFRWEPSCFTGFRG